MSAPVYVGVATSAILCSSEKRLVAHHGISRSGRSKSRASSMLPIQSDLRRSGDDACKVAAPDAQLAFVASLGDFKFRRTDDLSATAARFHLETFACSVRERTAKNPIVASDPHRNHSLGCPL